MQCIEDYDEGYLLALLPREVRRKASIQQETVSCWLIDVKSCLDKTELAR